MAVNSIKGIKGIRGFELAVWSIWVGALWMMAVLVAPALFKWLSRPEAGLVASRLFYMLAFASVVASGVLLMVSNTIAQAKPTPKVSALLLAVMAVSVGVIFWLHPTMDEMRQAMVGLEGDALAAQRAAFGKMHALSSVLYSFNMIAALAWGLCRYSVRNQ